MGDLVGAYVAVAAALILVDGWHSIVFRHGRHYPFGINFVAPMLAWVVLACAQVWPSAIKATATGVDLIRWGRVRHYPWKRVSHFAVDERARWRIAYMVLWPEHEPSGVDPARSGLTTETLPSLRGISPKELVERLHRKQQEVTGRQTTDSR